MTDVVTDLVTDLGTLPVDFVYVGLKPRAGAGGFALYQIGDAVAGHPMQAAIDDALRLCKDI